MNAAADDTISSNALTIVNATSGSAGGQSSPIVRPSYWNTRLTLISSVEATRSSLCTRRTHEQSRYMLIREINTHQMKKQQTLPWKKGSSMARQLRTSNSPPSTVRKPYRLIAGGASHPLAGKPYIPTAGVGTPYAPTAVAGTRYIPTAGVGTPYIPTAGGPLHSQAGTRSTTSVYGGR